MWPLKALWKRPNPEVAPTPVVGGEPSLSAFETLLNRVSELQGHVNRLALEVDLLKREREERDAQVVQARATWTQLSRQMIGALDRTRRADDEAIDTSTFKRRIGL